MNGKEKTILCILMATVFLIPLMGNTAVASVTTGCFSGYDPFEAWETNPWNMADCDQYTYASTTSDGDVQLLKDVVTTTSISDTITKVEIRAWGYYSVLGNDADIILRPVFRLGDGDNHVYDCDSMPGWSQWFDITTDTNAPDPWTAADVYNLECDVEADGSGRFTLYCSILQIRVTWT